MHLNRPDSENIYVQLLPLLAIIDELSTLNIFISISLKAIENGRVGNFISSFEKEEQIVASEETGF